MKGFIEKLQQDLQSIQQTIQLEGKDLIERLKRTVNKEEVEKIRQEIAEHLGEKLQKFEPAVAKFVHEAKKGARKIGVDVSSIDKGIEKAIEFSKRTLLDEEPTVKETPETSSEEKKKPKEKTTP